MPQHASAIQGLVAALGAWAERALDRYRLPRPALGTLTMREMRYFTLYHELHHMQVAARRAAESDQG